MKEMHLALYRHLGYYEFTSLSNYTNKFRDTCTLGKDLLESICIIVNACQKDLKDDESIVIHLMNGIECEAIWTVTHNCTFCGDAGNQM